MSATQTKILYTVLFFVSILLSGYRLSRSGKPYSTFILTVHKLVSLGAIVFLVVTLIRFNRTVPLSSTVWIAGAVTAVFFLGLITTGGLLSAGVRVSTASTKVHHIAPYLTVLSTAATLYLLLVSR